MPEPWWREDRDAWFVQIDRKRYNWTYPEMVGAMCVKHLDALGVYSMPAGLNEDLRVFVAIRAIHKATGT